MSDQIELKECHDFKIQIFLNMLSLSKKEIVYKMSIMESRKASVEFKG